MGETRVRSFTRGHGIGYLCVIAIFGVLLLYLLGYVGDIIVFSLLLVCPILHYLILKRNYKKREP